MDVPVSRSQQCVLAVRILIFDRQKRADQLLH